MIQKMHEIRQAVALLETEGFDCTGICLEIEARLEETALALNCSGERQVRPKKETTGVFFASWQGDKPPVFSLGIAGEGRQYTLTEGQRSGLASLTNQPVPTRVVLETIAAFEGTLVALTFRSDGRRRYHLIGEDLEKWFDTPGWAPAQAEPKQRAVSTKKPTKRDEEIARVNKLFNDLGI